MAFRQFSSVETPCVLLDKSKLQDNIRRIHKIADTHHVNVRPHIKTHKCLEIFQLQEDVGAVGITVTKPEEDAGALEQAKQLNASGKTVLIDVHSNLEARRSTY